MGKDGCGGSYGDEARRVYREAAKPTVGDVIRYHGVVQQYAGGNPKRAEFGYAYNRELEIIKIFEKRGHVWIEAGPDEYGNTYVGALKQAEKI